jgi:hypothetical protein
MTSSKRPKSNHKLSYQQSNNDAAYGHFFFMTPESSFERLLGNGLRVAVAKEFLNQCPYRLKDQTVNVVLRASAKGYGGMGCQRQRNLLVCDDSNGFEDWFEIQEALSQAIIEAIFANTRKGGVRSLKVRVGHAE